MSVTFKTQALIDAAEAILKRHTEAVEEWKQKTAQYKAEHQETWWVNNEERVKDLRNYLTRCLKNGTPPLASEATKLMGRNDGYVYLFTPAGEPNGDKPQGYYVRRVGDLPGLVALLKAHTGDTISANELKLVGYDQLQELFALAAAAGGRADSK